jgi:hypothetical protein
MVDRTKLVDTLKGLTRLAAQVGVLLVVSYVIIALAVEWFGQIKDATKLALCHQAATCKKYSEVRQEVQRRGISRLA